ncbi:alpha/beta fold hydrolase [Nocardia sp. NPDC052278]|uniref:alpha/beta fold hydrolase n=1 Tax=unclassified Nocardia TaxID=2637762 RepID=UPI0036A7526E
MSTYTPVNAAEDLHVDGASARFTYRRIGPRGGVPLVLLHRFRATVDWWDPEFLDLLAAERDVILFDNIGIGYTGGEALTSVEGFAAGAIDFIEALGLTEVDLLGWSFGGVVAQAVTLMRPDLVRKLIVAGSGSGLAPNMPTITERVLGIMAKPDADLEDMLYLFYPETEEARKLGLEHFDKVSAAMPTDAPVVSEAAAMGAAPGSHRGAGDAVGAGCRGARNDSAACALCQRFARRHDSRLRVVLRCGAPPVGQVGAVQRRRPRVPVPASRGIHGRGEVLPRRLSFVLAYACRSRQSVGIDRRLRPGLIGARNVT